MTAFILDSNSAGELACAISSTSSSKSLRQLASRPLRRMHRLSSSPTLFSMTLRSVVGLHGVASVFMVTALGLLRELSDPCLHQPANERGWQGSLRREPNRPSTRVVSGQFRSQG